MVDTKECNNKPDYVCPNKTKEIKKGQENAAFDHTECRLNCVYIDEINFDYIDGNKCVSSCPTTGNIYYTKNGESSPECKDRCDDNKFYDYITKECLDDCNFPKKFHKEPGTNFFKCFDGECNSDYNYKYKNACLNKCKDTLSITKFGNITTYLNGDICVENCFLYNQYAYENEDNESKCVSSCMNDTDDKKKKYWDMIV